MTQEDMVSWLLLLLLLLLLQLLLLRVRVLVLLLLMSVERRNGRVASDGEVEQRRLDDRWVLVRVLAVDLHDVRCLFVAQVVADGSHEESASIGETAKCQGEA